MRAIHPILAVEIAYREPRGRGASRNDLDARAKADAGEAVAHRPREADCASVWITCSPMSRSTDRRAFCSG